MKTKEYKAIKNLLHNELGLSKEDIKEVVLEVIRDETKSQVQKVMKNNPQLFISKKIKDMVEGHVKRFLNQSTYSSQSRELMQTIGTEVAKQLRIEVKSQ